MKTNKTEEKKCECSCHIPGMEVGVPIHSKLTALPCPHCAPDERRTEKYDNYDFIDAGGLSDEDMDKQEILQSTKE